MKKVILGSLILGSYALAWSTSPVTKISKLYTYPESVVLKIENAFVGSGCSNGSYVAFDSTTSGGKALFSAALTAYTTGMKVRFGANDCITWGGTIPKIYRIEMIK